MRLRFREWPESVQHQPRRFPVAATLQKTVICLVGSGIELMLCSPCFEGAPPRARPLSPAPAAARPGHQRVDLLQFREAAGLGAEIADEARKTRRPLPGCERLAGADRMRASLKVRSASAAVLFLILARAASSRGCHVSKRRLYRNWRPAHRLCQ